MLLVLTLSLYPTLYQSHSNLCSFMCVSSLISLFHLFFLVTFTLPFLYLIYFSYLFYPSPLSILPSPTCDQFLIISVKPQTKDGGLPVLPPKWHWCLCAWLWRGLPFAVTSGEDVRPLPVTRRLVSCWSQDVAHSVQVVMKELTAVKRHFLHVFKDYKRFQLVELKPCWPNNYMLC